MMLIIISDQKIQNKEKKTKQTKFSNKNMQQKKQNSNKIKQE